MFIVPSKKKGSAVKRSGKVDRVFDSSSFPLLLTAPEVFILLGYKHWTPSGVLDHRHFLRFGHNCCSVPNFDPLQIQTVMLRSRA